MNEYTRKNLEDTQRKILDSESTYIGNRIEYYADQLKDQKELYALAQDKDPDLIDDRRENRIAYYSAMIQMLEKLQTAIESINVIE